jgi:signal transduction histidine kinase/CheY-like chemotaxis protein
MTMDGEPGHDERGLPATGDELYEDAPCAHLSTLPDGTIVRCNRTFTAWLGLGSEAVAGTRFQAFLTVGSRIYYETHYSPLLQMQGFVNEIALEMRLANGDVRPVVASARQLRDSHGAATENRIALFDSTDRRRYEREIVHARKAAEQAAADLAEADKRKSEFIALLAHELRNPLAPIRSAVEILRRSEHANDLVKRTSEIMMRQVTQLTRLVDDLLDVSRLGQDKLVVNRVAVDLSSIVHQAVETSRPLFEAAGITFVMALPSSSIYVDADASRLAQVFENILNNAAKFTPRGGSVTLTLQRDAEQARIRVRDTGIGIEPGQLSRIFDLFMQAGAASKRHDGLGIGLMLARSLIERHGGRISVESAGRGHGSEFAVTLPLLLEAPSSLSHPFVRTRDAGPTPSRRVLVVDDNADSAEMIGLMLRFAGHQVQMAFDGNQALTAIATFAPEVVLLDIGLPVLNGYEVAERIRAGSGPQPLLVALTGWGQDEDRRRSTAAGFDAHLVKPVDHEELLNLVAHFNDSV